MTVQILQEYVECMGLVTQQELHEQAGLAVDVLEKSMAELLENRELFLCRINAGQETVVSKHLLFCMRAVYREPDFSMEEQDLYDWLSENELSSAERMYRESDLRQKAFESAFLKLQQKMSIAPVRMQEKTKSKIQLTLVDSALVGSKELLWVTDDCWLHGVQKPARYRDLEYCLAEIRRLLDKCFTTKQVDNLIFRGKLLFDT